MPADSDGANGLGPDVAPVTRTIGAPVETVWSVLADGWVYPTWVVGASRMRAVDLEWPARGSRLHHSFGIWPALINDSTEVLRSDPPRELVLKARGWPTGEAHVRVLLTPTGPQSAAVEFYEDAVSGPTLALPRPARQALIRPRNVETLRRLAFIAEGFAKREVAAPR